MKLTLYTENALRVLAHLAGSIDWTAAPEIIDLSEPSPNRPFSLADYIA